jgi:hypothetical protein
LVKNLSEFCFLNLVLLKEAQAAKWFNAKADMVKLPASADFERIE